MPLGDFERAVLRVLAANRHPDSFRFFPVEPDLDLGWRLSFLDAATNKVLAFAGRSELRDLLDVIFLHEQHLHLGALAWAAAGKDPGMSPEAIILWARRNARYPTEDLRDIRTAKPVDLRAAKERWMEFSETALALIQRLPPAEMGCLYLDPTGKAICPDPRAPDFGRLTRHFGSVKGAVPRVAEK